MSMVVRKSRASRQSADVRKVVKSILNARVEHKHSAFIFSATSAAAGVVTPLTQGIIQGDDLNQRSGSQIILEKMKFWITSTAVTASKSTLRVIIFVDHVNLGTLPAVTDVLTGATPTDAYALNAQSMGRFKILADFYLLTSYSATGTSSGGLPQIASKEFRFNLKDKVQYNAATSVSNANGKGAVFMLFIDTGANTVYNVGTNLTYSDA